MCPDLYTSLPHKNVLKVGIEVRVDRPPYLYPHGVGRVRRMRVQEVPSQDARVKMAF